MMIYVSNISLDATEDELRVLFGAHGHAQRATIVRNKETGRPRGFGFVNMAQRSEGEATIAALDGTEHWGCKLNVSEARDQRTVSAHF